MNLLKITTLILIEITRINFLLKFRVFLGLENSTSLEKATTLHLLPPLLAVGARTRRRPATRLTLPRLASPTILVPMVFILLRVVNTLGLAVVPLHLRVLVVF